MDATRGGLVFLRLANGSAEPNFSIPTATALERRPAWAGCMRGVVFDLEGVLYDATLWRRWLWQLLVRLEIHGDYNSFFAPWDRNFLPQVYRGQRDFHEALAGFLAAAGLKPGQINEIGAASRGRRGKLGLQVRPLPGVAATLRQLSALGYRLAVLADSDFTSAAIKERLGGLSLAHCFTAVLSSAELHHTKPANECYQAAVAALNIPPDQLAFVGHDRASLAGAAQLKMATIAYNYQPDCRADVYLDRFEELLTVLNPAATGRLAG